MPACHPTLCLFTSLPLDNSPHFCFDCKARFHGVCQNVVRHPKADALKLSFCFEYLCPGCANAKPSSNTQGELSTVVEVGNKQQRSRKGVRKRKQPNPEITSVAVPERRCSSSSSSNNRVADIPDDEFISKLVAFNCNTNYCKELIASFGKKFSLDAICTELNADHGHIVGVIMRKSKVVGRRIATSDSYDVAWEFSALGESSLPGVVLVNASIAGSRVQQLRSSRSGTQALLDDNVTVEESVTVERQRGRPKGSKKNRSFMDQIRRSLEMGSDVDSFGAAPDSDSDREVEVADNVEVADDVEAAAAGADLSEDGEDSLGIPADDMFDWLVFGEDPNDTSAQPVVGDDSNEMVAVEKEPEPHNPNLVGLHWVVGSSINEPPHDKMDEQPASLKDEYKHLFKTPIDAMFAVMPYAFWELMVLEINRYASQGMDKSNKKYIYILGKKWKPVTVGEMITYFGMLIYFMLYPQTGRRLRSAWKDQEFNFWTKHMSRDRFQQISSTLHFNDNNDLLGSSMDSLHKIRPLLEILKRTLGRYGTFGSELSFDEATMACFSRYARCLISFNPKKPTGE
jgi:hypothetical protein